MEAISNGQSDHDVKSALHIEEPEQPRIDTSPSLDRSPNTLTTDGKSFGSMNLEEFINSIWTEEEAQAQNANSVMPTVEASTSLNNMNPQYHFGQTPKGSSDTARQMSLTRPENSGCVTRAIRWRNNILRISGQDRAPPLLPRLQLLYGSVDVPAPFGPQATSFYGVASGVRGSENIGEMGAVSLDEIGLNNRGRKRIIEGPSEMMIQRYETKLIINREAATKSRAKKQARTRELEAELNHLKKRKFLPHGKFEMFLVNNLQQLEAEKTEAQEKAKEKRGTFRRTLSCPH
ncbi:uncharacterized protein LOC141679272 [Apium graveolens]|uniref:uncharacterized protein LOC141679272 n=1 Tax=Apium graveolens TaxID=4045 RepID=UPI003D798150